MFRLDVGLLVSVLREHEQSPAAAGHSALDGPLDTVRSQLEHSRCWPRQREACVEVRLPWVLRGAKPITGAPAKAPANMRLGSRGRHIQPGDGTAGPGIRYGDSFSRAGTSCIPQFVTRCCFMTVVTTVPKPQCRLAPAAQLVATELGPATGGACAGGAGGWGMPAGSRRRRAAAGCCSCCCCCCCLPGGAICYCHCQ